MALVALAGPVGANHPVLVEGNNGADGIGVVNVTPGMAGDWDGDGRIGVAEDTDNSTDRIFGTVTAAVNGVTIIEAAAGVEAVLDAVLAGDPGNAARQATSGIAVATTDTDRIVMLRNLVVRNFSVGLQVQGSARVVVDGCRFDSNVVTNVCVSDNGRLTMTGSSVVAGGMRFNPGKSTPDMGDGVLFEGTPGGTIGGTTIAGNTAAGIRNTGTGVVRASAGVGPCARCKTRKGVTTCRNCGVTLQ